MSEMKEQRKRQSPTGRRQRPRDVASDQPAEQTGDITPQDPGSMPRAEDDEAVFEKSPEFHDRPGGTNPVERR